MSYDGVDYPLLRKEDSNQKLYTANVILLSIVFILFIVTLLYGIFGIPIYTSHIHHIGDISTPGHSVNYTVSNAQHALNASLTNGIVFLMICTLLLLHIIIAIFELYILKKLSIPSFILSQITMIPMFVGLILTFICMGFAKSVQNEFAGIYTAVHTYAMIGIVIIVFYVIVHCVEFFFYGMNKVPPAKQFITFAIKLMLPILRRFRGK